MLIALVTVSGFSMSSSSLSFAQESDNLTGTFTIPKLIHQETLIG
jgi:hypothetical protein